MQKNQKKCSESMKQIMSFPRSHKLHDIEWVVMIFRRASAKRTWAWKARPENSWWGFPQPLHREAQPKCTAPCKPPQTTRSSRKHYQDPLHKMAPKNKGGDKGGASKDKGKGKGKAEPEEKATKVKGAQQINVRHVLVCIPCSGTRQRELLWCRGFGI